MVKDAFGEALGGFKRWLREADKPDADTELVVLGEARLLLDLMRDYLDIAGPAELTPDDLREILLRVYPRKVVVLPGEEIDLTIQVARALVAYLGDTRVVPEEAVRALEHELDDIAPQFADAVMNPLNWTPSKDFAKAMAEAGIDTTDRSAVTSFIESYNEGLDRNLYELYSEDDDLDVPDLDVPDIDVPDINVKEAFGLPDEMPPMRVLADAELAAQARQVPVIAQLRALAEWLGEGGEGRGVDEDGDLDASDAAAAAAAAGVDATRFPYLWDLALEAEFAEFGEDETQVIPGDTALDWATADDEDVLDTWQLLLGAVMARTLEVAASLDPDRASDLDFFGHGAGLLVMLFMGRAQGVPVAEVSEIIEGATTEQLPPAMRAKAWQSWVRAHGDVAKLLFDQLTSIGAVRLTEGEEGELAWLTPLGLSAMRTQFVQAGVDIPVLPPTEKLTAEELIAMAEGASEEEFNAEAAAWSAHRTPESAARDLLAVAAVADGASRLLAVAVTTELGAAAGPAWQAALGDPTLRGYAKTALARLDGDDIPGDLALEDLAGMLADTLAAEGWDDTGEDAGHDPAELANLLGEVIPPGQEQIAFETMARLPHGQVAAVLTVIGRHHPDKKIAKAARKAAYKATSRQAAVRR